MIGCLRGSRWIGFVATCLVGCGLCVSPTVASADIAPAPGWEVFGYSSPTVITPGSEGAVIERIYNDGSLPNTKIVPVLDSKGEPVLNARGEVEMETVDIPVTVTSTLPGGVVATGPTGAGCTGVGTKVVTCEVTKDTNGGAIGPAEDHAEVAIPVRVTASVSGEAVDHVSVSGGGANGVTSTSIPLRFGSESPGLGLADVGAWVSNADGSIDTQAGSHPYEMTIALSLNREAGEGSTVPSGGEPRSLDGILPPGLVGNPNVVPQCTRERFDEEGKPEPGVTGCPASSNIGWVEVEAKGIEGGALFPIFDLAPPAGVAAQFGFDVLGGNEVFIDARVRSGGDYGITAHSPDVPQRGVLFFRGTFWGVPGDPSHDPERYGTGCIPDGSGGCGSSGGTAPFLTLPTACQGPQAFTVEETSTWQEEHTDASRSFLSQDQNGQPAGFTGCERLVHFEPTINLAPDTTFSDTPAGLTATVKLPQGLNPEGLATSGLKETTVTLPEGIVINPGQATGLVACQSSEENLGGESEAFDGPPSCPAASKVGTDEIATPLLPKRLKGNVYILQNNPPDLQLLVVASGEGVNLKLIGTVHLNEQTGQLVTTFEGTPQDPGTPDAPLTEFVLSFSGGAQAALVTPQLCGTYGSSVDFTPWSTPFVQDAMLESKFQISSGPAGSACQDPLPFAPVMTAGATTDQAGGYTDFSMLLQRGDGQQRVSSLSFKTPEGLLGMIAKVPLCQEPLAAAGTCSAASQIGHTIVGAGPGPYPLFIPQAGAPPAPIYLTGPYKGAPFGLSIVVPLIAGPFNLGTEIVRARIEVDRHTSQITVITDPLPTIVKGIPADLRSINAVIDRPEFMFNPTNCNPMSFSGTATSTEGVVAALSSHFQMGSCQALKFQPNFKVSTTGKTSRTNGASLTAKIVYPVGNLGFNQASSQSNINSVKVDLPKQLPSRLTTLQKACTAATFAANPANCPSASIVGHAKAVTPVLPVPLEGPAYFVSHAGEEFPSLIVVLQGYGVTVELVGTTFINSKTNITSSTFKQVPDVPIGLFELVLPQGKYSALAANGNLCKTKLTMPTAFIAQNGATLHQTTPVSVTGCPKGKKSKKTKARAKVKRKGKK